MLGRLRNIFLSLISAARPGSAQGFALFSLGHEYDRSHWGAVNLYVTLSVAGVLVPWCVQRGNSGATGGILDEQWDATGIDHHQYHVYV